MPKVLTAENFNVSSKKADNILAYWKKKKKKLRLKQSLGRVFICNMRNNIQKLYL